MFLLIDNIHLKTWVWEEIWPWGEVQYYDKDHGPGSWNHSWHQQSTVQVICPLCTQNPNIYYGNNKNSILVLLGQINDLMDIKHFNSIWHVVNLVHTLTVISLYNIDRWLIRIQRVICSLKALERIRQNEKGIIISRRTLRNLWNTWHFQDRERRNTQWEIKHGKWNTKNMFKEGANMYSAIKTFSSSRKASTEMHLWD